MAVSQRGIAKAAPSPRLELFQRETLGALVVCCSYQDWGRKTCIRSISVPKKLRMLWASVVLGLVQVTLAVLFAAASGRAGWALGSRDKEGPLLGKFAGRVERAWQNYLQTFPIFAATVLLANALKRLLCLGPTHADSGFG